MDKVELSVLVPSDRVGEFYALVGQWLLDVEEKGEEATPSGRRRRGRARPTRRAGPARVSRYAPLADYLQSQEADRVEVSFEEIERILGASLPQSAHNHRAWWANARTHKQAEVWLDAGWQVASVDLEGRTVEFARLEE